MSSEFDSSWVVETEDFPTHHLCIAFTIELVIDTQPVLHSCASAALSGWLPSHDRPLEGNKIRVNVERPTGTLQMCLSGKFSKARNNLFFSVSCRNANACPPAPPVNCLPSYMEATNFTVCHEHHPISDRTFLVFWQSCHGGCCGVLSVNGIVGLARTTRPGTFIN